MLDSPCECSVCEKQVMFPPWKMRKSVANTSFTFHPRRPPGRLRRCKQRKCGWRKSEKTGAEGGIIIGGDAFVGCWRWQWSYPWWPLTGLCRSQGGSVCPLHCRLLKTQSQPVAVHPSRENSPYSFFLALSSCFDSETPVTEGSENCTLGRSSRRSRPPRPFARRPAQPGP